MVYKVIMDIVRIITFFVSGMINVSEFTFYVLVRTLELVAYVCVVLRSGERCMFRILYCCCFYFFSLGGLGVLIF